MSTIEAVSPQEWTQALVDELHNRDPDWVIVEVSGGHDSTAMLYAVAEAGLDIDAVFHINTGTGIGTTHQYVREQCARLGLPLIEGIQPDMEQRYGPKFIVHGGPGANLVAHEMMRRDLKQDVEDKLVQSFGGEIAIVTGVSRHESPRRKRTVAESGIQKSKRHPRVTNYAPVAEYLGTELNDVLKRHGVERNPAADLLGSSGECLCAVFGSFFDLAYIWEYDPLRVISLYHLMHLANQYWQEYYQEHGEPPYPRQYLIWGHGGVDDRVLDQLVVGGLDDPADFRDSDYEKRAQKAREDAGQFSLGDKCSSCNFEVAQDA